MKRIAEKLGGKLHVPPSVITKVYEAYWTFIRAKIEELPLGDNPSEQEYSKLKVNFNIPCLGKLRCTYGDQYKKSKTDVQPSHHHNGEV